MRATTWQDDAACRVVSDPELFFPPAGPPPRVVRQFCSACPVRAACLDFAMGIEGDLISDGYRFGIWGGATPHERSRIARRRRAS